MGKRYVFIGVVTSFGKRGQVVHRPGFFGYGATAEMACPVVSFSKLVKKDYFSFRSPFFSRSSNPVVRFDCWFVPKVVSLFAFLLILSCSFKVSRAVSSRVLTPLSALLFWIQGGIIIL